MGQRFKIKDADLQYAFLKWSVAGVSQIVSCVMNGPESFFVGGGGRDGDKKARPRKTCFV